MAAAIRPRRVDDLGLRRALSDRLLPLLVAAMVFLGALALAGALAASSLARHWQGGAAALMTVQVPDPAQADALNDRLKTVPGIAVHRLTPEEELRVLSPWLGGDSKLALALPAVFAVTLGPGAAAAAVTMQIRAAAPGALIERNGPWFERLALLARSLQASALVALLVVGLVAVAVTAVATRAGLSARRESIEIVHALGAADGLIAARFANRVTLLVLGGAAVGVAVAVPMLLTLATLAAPFADPGAASGAAGASAGVLALLPAPLWAALPVLPVLACAIGWLTAQATVRRWLARLP